MPVATASRKLSTFEGPLTISEPCNSRFIAENSTNWHDEVLSQTSVECAAVLRANTRQLSRPVAGMPQLVTIRFSPDDSSNAREPACASWLTPGGGGVPVSTITIV